MLSARARLEQLIAWVAPVAEEIGVDRYVRLPERNSAERRSRSSRRAATLAEVYAGQTGLPVPGLRVSAAARAASPGRQESRFQPATGSGL